MHICFGNRNWVSLILNFPLSQTGYETNTHIQNADSTMFVYLLALRKQYVQNKKEQKYMYICTLYENTDSQN